MKPATFNLNIYCYPRTYFFTWAEGVQNVLFFTIYVPIRRYGDFNTLQ
jgi:hypothetical protein